MEHHRLKPMAEGYDKDLFEKIYENTSALRKKLAFEIDARKFGVDYQEILSWFDVKFIHAFNKYYKKDHWNGDPGRLQGYIINALSTYKYRVMRSSYQAKYHNHNNTIDITTFYEYDDVMAEIPDTYSEKEKHLRAVMKFMKQQLDDNALLVMDIQLNPPPFITSRLVDMGKKESSRIPAELIADYLNLGKNEIVISYINDLKTEVRNAISNAKRYFELNPLQTASA